MSTEAANLTYSLGSNITVRWEFFIRTFPIRTNENVPLTVKTALPYYSCPTKTDGRQYRFLLNEGFSSTGL